MKSILKWLLFALVILIAAFLAWDQFVSYRTTHSWNQKLTVNVMTPTGMKSGSATTRITKKLARYVPGSGDLAKTELVGEATVVKVAPGKFLFALLKGASHQGRAVQIAQHAFNAIKLRKTYVERNAYISSLRTTAPVPPKSYPLLVTFDDLSDPASVKEVDPSDLAATFGPGYALKSITLEITDEPVTTGKVEQVLGWLRNVWPNRLDGQRYETIKASNRFANSLATGDFSTEVRK